MIEFVEDKNLESEQQTTAPSETATIVADFSPTIAEQSQTFSDNSPTIGEPTSDTPQVASFNPENYPLDSHQVLSQFLAAGISRTPRAIQRYCKEGKLDAYFHPHRKMYLVTTASVQKLIAAIKTIDERHNASLFRDEPTRQSEPKATVADSSQNEREPSATVSQEVPRTGAIGERVKELEAQVQTLEIDKRVRDQIISKLETQIRDDRDHFTEKLTGMARLAESFKTRLRLLAAPKESRGVVDDISDVDAIEASVIGQSDPLNGNLETDREKE